MPNITVFFVFLLLTLCGVNAQNIYISPQNNSQYHLPEATIIIRQGSNYTKDINPEIFEIRTVSGQNIPFDLIFAQDKKTIILKPREVFKNGDKILWTIKDNLRFENGIIKPGDFSFNICKKNCRKPQNENPKAEKSGIPENFPDFCIFLDSGYFEAPLFFYNISAFAMNYDRFLSIMNSDSTFYYSKPENNKGLNFDFQLQKYLTYWGEQQFMVMDTSFNVVDSFACGNGYQTDWHDFVLLPDFHAFVFSYDAQNVDMTVYVPDGNPNALVEGLVIQEIDSLKNVIFQWRSWDNFEITDATETDFTEDYFPYVHGNAMHVCKDGNLLLSSRLMNEITKINRTTGEIIWRLGGKNNMFELTDSTEEKTFNRQHDVQELENGNILLFDNGTSHLTTVSSAKEYAIDTSLMKVNLVWSYYHPDNILGLRMGSVQRLGNNNTLICWGLQSNPSVDVTEVDSSGRICYEFNIVDNSNYLYRAKKYFWNHYPESVLEVDFVEKIFLFPNPVKDKLYIGPKSGDIQISKIEILDLYGKKVYSNNSLKKDKGNQIPIDLSLLKAGLYIIAIDTGSVRVSKKIIKL